MIDHLRRKLSLQRRNKILLEVREQNLPAQLFFRNQGFRAISLLRGFYLDTDEDAYLMQYKVGELHDASFIPKNRIAHYVE
jgi:ribosomal-protein-alanine N-acetyltransferase